MNYCPYCKGELRSIDKGWYKCPNCGATHNPDFKKKVKRATKRAKKIS